MRSGVVKAMIGLILAGALAGGRWSTGQTVAGPTTPTAAADRPTSPGAASDPEAVKWLRTLQERHSDHRRASGTFYQVRQDPVFLEDVESTGQFWYERPNRFKCVYEKPEQSTHWVIDHVVTSYFPSLKMVERYRLRREGSGIGDVNPILLALGVETDQLLRHFSVSTVPTTATKARLSFVPRAPREERPFNTFLLDISNDLEPLGFTIEGEEDKTRVEIRTLKWNEQFTSGTFDLNFPPDVEIVEGQ